MGYRMYIRLADIEEWSLFESSKLIGYASEEDLTSFKYLQKLAREGGWIKADEDTLHQLQDYGLLCASAGTGDILINEMDFKIFIKYYIRDALKNGKETLGTSGQLGLSLLEIAELPGSKIIYFS